MISWPRPKTRARLHKFADHEEIRSLREEIALARMLAEPRWNMVKNDNDLIMACGSLNTLLLPSNGS